MRIVQSDELKLVLRATLPELSAQLSALVPESELFHIGSTAIPGALTKGDLDVLLRVDSDRFQSAVAALKAKFAVKQPENWTNVFASFGDDSSFQIPVGIQLVVKDSTADFFLFLHDHFVSNPDSLAEYNRIKLEFAPLGPDEY